jgi:OOP family OmpA-OmpF porin
VKDIKLLGFLLLLFFSARSQTDSLTLKKAGAGALKSLGKNAMRQNDPSSAITFFEAYLKQKPNDAYAMNLLGKSYMEVRDYERAQRMFLRAYNADKEKAPDALYYHAQMQKSNMMYDSARINFQRFKKEYKGGEKVLKRQATKEIVFCDSVIKLIGVEYKIVVQHLDTTINKVNSEAGPSSWDDTTLLFSSLRTEKIEYITDDDTSSQVKRKLYKAVFRNGEWKFVGEYEGGFNDDDFNTGNACFSADRKRIYFTRCKTNMFEKMICAIYVSEKKGDTWTEPVKLPKQVNNPKYTSTMPAVTTDPVKGNETIYFVSDRKDGKGGMDIWYTVFDKKKNIYKLPRNAGTKVNTSQDEMTPFFDNETRTLYFSSDGLGGLGGFDIYRTKGDGKKFTGAENIGQPINSGADELFYTISTNRGEGFFVSNRKGGNALKNATCCDDIYYYKHAEYIRITLKGTVGDATNNTFVPNATVEIFITDKKNKDKFIVKTIKTDSTGKYETNLEPDQDYYLVVKKEDFLGTHEVVTTKDMTMSKDINKDIQLTRKPREAIHIPNVRYEYDRANLQASSKTVLDSSVYKLMIANPELIIEIQSHTDSKGTDAYNLKLSQKRAESVVEYLISKGIAPERLKPTGYGETQPIAPNENPDGSDNPEGRTRNRRTSFKIIGVLDTEIINDQE